MNPRDSERAHFSFTWRFVITGVPLHLSQFAGSKVVDKNRGVINMPI